MSKRTIAVVDPVGARAGMDYYSQNLLIGFSNNGSKCLLFSNTDSELNASFLSIRTFTFFSSNPILKGMKLILGHLRASLLCRRHKVDVAIFHVFSTNFACFIGFFIAKLFRLKVLAIVHDVESFGDDDTDFFKKMIYGKLCDFISVHNERSQYILSRHLADASINTTPYIAEQGSYVNQIDPAISKQKARKDLGLTEADQYGLFFGQIKKTKGLDTLLLAWGKEKLPCKLIIAGKPWKQSFDEYQKIIDEYSIEDSVIKTTRYIEDSERELFFKAADFVILPYTEIYQSAVLLMAMSYGLPVIATDIEGFSIIVNDADCGLLFSLGDSDDLNRKILKLVESEALLKRFSENSSFATATKYSWDTVAAAHLQNLNLYS